MTRRPNPSWVVLQWTTTRPFWATVTQGSETDATNRYRDLLPHFLEREKVGIRLYNDEGKMVRWAGDPDIAKPGADA